MSPTESHLGPEEFYQFVEGTLPRSRSKEVEEHFNLCSDCREALSRVLAAARLGTAEEEAVLARWEQGPEDVLRRLRPHIAASTPGPGSLSRSRFGGRAGLALAAGVAGLLLGGYLVNRHFIAPSRSRALAAAALEELIELRQGTGKVPLRYLSGFERARVTRSSFETADPSEESIERRLRRAVALAPDEPAARQALGLFLIDTAQPAEAEAELEKALELDPSSVDAANGLAVALYLRGQASGDNALVRRGVEILLEAQRRSYRDRQVAYNLGVLYEELGERAAAARAFRYYLREDPSSEWAQVAREKILALEGEPP
jgi:tetratricopeptide (TPR) repeat protein